MGYENVISSSHQRRYGSQPISVPFLWEQKPGMPKSDWNAKPIPFFTAKISKAKPVSSRETAIIPLNLVISVPFQWEEKPGKPLLTDENPCSTVLPAAFPSCNPFINEEENVVDVLAFGMHHASFSSDQNYSSFHGSTNECDSSQTECWYSVSERDCRSDSSRSAMHNELEVKSCNTNLSQLVKRTLTLGELILLSRGLSCPKKAVYVRKERLFSMELIRRGLSACFSFRTNVQKKQ